MNTKKRIKKLLYRSFDDRLSENDQKTITLALEQSEDLRNFKKEIQAQRNAISSTAVHSFNPYFADQLMERINEFAGKSYGLDFQTFYDSLVSVFRRFALAGSVISIILFIYNLGSPIMLSMEDAIIMPDLTIREILSIFL